MRIVQRSGRWRWIASLTVLLLAAGVAGAPTSRAEDPLDIARLEVSDVVEVPLLGLPLPNAGDGVGPGSYLLIEQTDGNTYVCTANFVWTSGGQRYLGAAGHCFLPADVEASPAADPGRYVTRVRACVASCLFGGQLGGVIQGSFVELGDVAYARQARNGAQVGHDFGLVEIPAGTPGVRTSVPVWGGPTGSAPIGVLSPVCLYGNAIGFGELFLTKARVGLGSSTHDGAWYANIPSLMGDSGSALVNCPGLSGTTAVGILTHLATDGTGVIAGTTVQQARNMVVADTGMTIQLVNG